MIFNHPLKIRGVVSSVLTTLEFSGARPFSCSRAIANGFLWHVCVETVLSSPLISLTVPLARLQ